MIIVVAGIWQMKSRAPIRYVRIEGKLGHLRLDEVRRVLRPFPRDYWSLDLGEVSAAVRRLPWVEEVHARRVWPDVLVLGIREQMPYLRWGEKALLNRSGEKFAPRDVSPYGDLPQLTGPAGYEGRLFAAYQRIRAVLLPLGLKPVRLQVDGRRSWRLSLDPPMEIVLGRAGPEDNFSRVARALVRLGAERCRRIGYLDARYEHGFAIRWRDPEPSTTKAE